MQQSGDTEDIVVADVGHGTFDDVLAGLQTAVTLERIPRSLAIDPVEYVQLSDPGYQHQLHRAEEGEGEGNRAAEWGSYFTCPGSQI